MKQFCYCSEEIISNTSCEYVCSKCGRKWEYNLEKQVYEIKMPLEWNIYSALVKKKLV